MIAKLKIWWQNRYSDDHIVWTRDDPDTPVTDEQAQAAMHIFLDAKRRQTRRYRALTLILFFLSIVSFWIYYMIFHGTHYWGFRVAGIFLTAGAFSFFTDWRRERQWLRD